MYSTISNQPDEKFEDINLNPVRKLGWGFLSNGVKGVQNGFSEKGF
jgi:hypothetical protein